MRTLLLAACLLPCGFAARAEGAAVVAGPIPHAEVTVTLDGKDYIAMIGPSGAGSTNVNGADLDLSGLLPDGVLISRADGGSMADEGYRAREVLEAACAARGLRADAAAVPVLSPSGGWSFVGGCE